MNTKKILISLGILIVIFFIILSFSTKSPSSTNTSPELAATDTGAEAVLEKIQKSLGLELGINMEEDMLPPWFFPEYGTKVIMRGRNFFLKTGDTGKTNLSGSIKAVETFFAKAGFVKNDQQKAISVNTYPGPLLAYEKGELKCLADYSVFPNDINPVTQSPLYSVSFSCGTISETDKIMGPELKKLLSLTGENPNKTGISINEIKGNQVTYRLYNPEEGFSGPFGAKKTSAGWVEVSTHN